MPRVLDPKAHCPIWGTKLRTVRRNQRFNIALTFNSGIHIQSRSENVRFSGPYGDRFCVVSAPLMDYASPGGIVLELGHQ
jgi:hypothetical protein